MINNVPASVFDFPADDEAELIQLFPAILRGKPPAEAAHLHRCFLGKQSGPTSASESGAPATTVCSLCAKAVVEAATLRDLRQPPHAAD